MKTSDNDIAEPRYKLAQSEAGRIWGTLAGSKVPVQLNDIVKAMDVNVKEENIPQGIRSDGATTMDNSGKCTIRYRKDISVERQRFTVAHELGHIVLEHVSFDGSSSQCSGGSQEKEANAFAGALLVPLKDLKTFMKNKDKTIEDIVSRYWVSKDVASIAVTGNKLLNKIRID
ncbi:ImmA/IrrE family metallo-endopeptidase [Candidatus Peregrinibacteria bacterium]|nr:ImmA/IrrE family metallo-endopeptidase [Candidatus Peregrinibacteria bacterium]